MASLCGLELTDVSAELPRRARARSIPESSALERLHGEDHSSSNDLSKHVFPFLGESDSKPRAEKAQGCAGHESGWTWRPDVSLAIYTAEFLSYLRVWYLLTVLKTAAAHRSNT